VAPYRGPGRGRYRPSRGGALHDQLSQAVHRTDPNPGAAHWSDSSLRCSPRPDIGYVVLEASSAEDALGELLVLRKGLTVPDPQWWQSGETLVKALEGLADPDLQVIVDELRRILPPRHHVVHGLWVCRDDRCASPL